MVMFQPKILHNNAKDRLSQIPDSPNRLILLHTAVALGATLLMTVLNYLFNQQISNTGGLSGIGLRSMLSTAQSTVELLVLILLPFWEIGIISVALGWSKGKNARFSDLLQGFRSFRPVLGFRILLTILLVALAIALFYLSTSIFTMTPLAKPLSDLLVPILEKAETQAQMQEMLTPEVIQQAFRMMIPLFIGYGVICLAILIPLLYRLRFAEFALMEGFSGRQAMAFSFRITKGNCWQIAKVDLHFWWFYLLQVLSLTVCYADVILTAAGVMLPIHPDLQFFLFYILGMLCQLALLWRYQAERITAFSLAYDVCKTPFATPTEA